MVLLINIFPYFIFFKLEIHDCFMVYYCGSLFHRCCVCCFINISYKYLFITVVTRVFTMGNVKDEFTYSVYKTIINCSNQLIFNSCCTIYCMWQLHIVDSEVSCFPPPVVLFDIICIPVTEFINTDSGLMIFHSTACTPKTD